jgi:hypothetical protein
MIKIEFQNAKVSDTGYGLEVNDTSLEETISRALGAKVGKGYNNDGVPFRANSCDITVIINPHTTSSTITVEDQPLDLEKYINDKEEQYGDSQKAKEADTEE